MPSWGLSCSGLLTGLCVVAMACVGVGVAQDSRDKMQWTEASNPQALCNDFTRAGFFIRRNASSDRWVIFLESGSLCFSSETCNNRFFRREVREGRCAGVQTGSRSAPDPTSNPFGDFDPATLSDCLHEMNTTFSEYVNPLMTSMKCLNRELFGENFTIEGRDLLDTDPDKNRDFFGHNHVLIPYCSSDLWLASELSSQQECNCSDLNCFEYTPGARHLQFAFRGRTIFESIFQQLLVDFGMDGASEIILGGSSAGGVGAVNLVPWVQDIMPPTADLLVIVDSAWFVDFQDGITKIFDGTTSDSAVDQADMMRLFGIIQSHPSCTDMSMGYPCCVSPYCVMTTQDNVTGLLKHYPQSRVRTFILSSVYDVFLLAPAVVGLDDFDSVSGGNQQNATSLLIDFLRVVGEYGGVMNFTLAQTFIEVPSVSYYLTQCFQHIYFATSTLWGINGETVFGNAPIELAEDLVSFSHTIQSGRWNSPLSRDATARQAISEWYTNRTDMRFLDFCQGPYCNEQCPDEFILGELTSNNWPVWAKLTISTAILSIGVVCLIMKILFYLWLYRLEKKQDDYLESLDMGLEEADEGQTQLMFPHCSDWIAVSCLDLTYNVSFQANKNVKDEQKDETRAVVLQDLTEEEPAQETTPGGRRMSRSLRRRSRFTSLRESFLNRSSTPVDPEMSLVPGRIPTPPPPPPLPVILPVEEEPTYNACGCQAKRNKEILRGISIYFNPGEMIGIMGPSGCGKTTLLDLLTGRRKSGLIGGSIYVNGIPMSEIRDWYIANTGYVLQLARPYYEEMTVRDNLTLAAQIKLPESDELTFKDKLKRVEQVMQVTGLTHLADAVVGGETGPGLSGGQKRRLVVALQLLKIPSVIFLDEPTSGLDATSSMELLSHLNRLAETNRTVILTIHQPRFEIFHMFHKLVLISDGRVAYHGAPEKAYEVFVSALRERYLNQGLLIPSLGDHNPADVIMDMLGNPRFRRVLTEYYQDSREPKLVRQAVKVARWREYSQSSSSMDSLGSAVHFALFGAKKVGQRHAHTFTRMAAMEARATKRIPLSKTLFLPFIFFAFACILGTSYFQQTQAFLVVSGMCVFSVASGLFVFPAIELYYTPAIRVYGYERGDGVGRAQDLVVQGFIRYISLAFLPVILSSGAIYLLLIDRSQYDILVFLQVAVVNVALNLSWTALLISLMLALPTTAFRLSPVISSVFGFTSGFFIPINEIPWWYRWLSFINPNYYGFSSVAFFLLENFSSGCVGSELECYFNSGAFTLRQFFFDTVNPYLHLLILFFFMVFYLCLAIFVHWAIHTSLGAKMSRLMAVVFKKPTDQLSKEIKSDRAGYERSISMAESLDTESFEVGDDDFSALSPDDDDATTPLRPIPEEEEEEEEERKGEVNGVGNAGDAGAKTKSAIRNKWQQIAERSLERGSNGESGSVEDSITSTGSGWNKVKMVRIQDEPKRPKQLPLLKKQQKNLRTPFLREGETHAVWRPKKRPQLANLVDLLKTNEAPETGKPNNSPQQPTTPKDHLKPGLLVPTVSRTPSLRSRQKTLFNRVIATQAILKEHTDELLNDEKPEEESKPRHLSLLEASKKVTASLKRQKSDEESKNFSDIVSQYLNKSKPEVEEKREELTTSGSSSSGGGWGALKSKKPLLVKKETRGAISIQTLRDLVKEEKMRAAASDDPALKRRSVGGMMFGTASPSDGHTPSQAGSNTATTPTDPPREIKLNKMAQLKKAVTERHQQQKQPELLEEGGASAESATNGVTTFNTNSNNNNNSPPTVVVEGDLRMGRHSVSGDLPRPKTAPSDSTSARRGSLTDIFVAKSTLPTLREEEGEGRSLTPEPPKSARRLRRQRKSEGDVSVGHVTVTSMDKDAGVSDPHDDDDVI